MPREDDAVHSIEQPVFQSAIVDGHSSEPSPDSSAVVSEDDVRGRSSSRLSRPKLGSVGLVQQYEVRVGLRAPALPSGKTTMSAPCLPDGTARRWTSSAKTQGATSSSKLKCSKPACKQSSTVWKQSRASTRNSRAVTSSCSRKSQVSTFRPLKRMLTHIPTRYIGELMQTSKITSSAPPKKGKGRIGK